MNQDNYCIDVTSAVRSIIYDTQATNVLTVKSITDAVTTNFKVTDKFVTQTDKLVSAFADHWTLGPQY